jgi:hypothetical protein
MIFGSVAIFREFCVEKLRPHDFVLGPFMDRFLCTIEDAIEVTLQLKVWYLWVDFICIDREDHARKGIRVNHGNFATID